jgi:anaphase-promoting complex subunit 8
VSRRYERHVHYQSLPLTVYGQLDQVLERLPQNLITWIFHIHASQELFQTTTAIFNQLAQVQSLFPTSLFLQTQRALLHYHAKDHEEAASLFNSILEVDPYRLDALDSYSNCLYVLEARPRLAFLAHLAAQTDKFRPETCCVIGNYYSLLSEHEKAVIYFRRALTLDRSFLSAWTLMGHEYVEMKNSHAALESYRRAVDVNRKDYRAWYGMGQTYEMLDMHSYALYYYQRASALRPFDAKIWGAVAKCFERVGKANNAIRAYKRALVAGSWYDRGGGGADASFGSDASALHGLAGGVLDPDCLFAIALLYERMGAQDECAAYMELCLAQEEGPGGLDEFDDEAGGGGGGGVGVTVTTSKARMWMAKWAYSRGDFKRALELATELCEDGIDVEEAKALQRDIRAREEAERG